MATRSATGLVSVVTPFHNTALHLRECIESVLRQTYDDFEYILHDNASDDGSTEIAREYAALDRRVRLVRSDVLLPQMQNYNRALTYISAQSRYCKMVQADDWIFPECLEKLIAVAELNTRIGLVSSLRMDGEHVRGEGLSYKDVHVTGHAAARFQLLTGHFLFGTPSTVLVRSDLIRERRPYFEENRFQEDTEACYEILKEWDFGFVHQILSYSRVETGSTFSKLHDNDGTALGNLINIYRYGPHFLTPSERRRRWREAQRRYYRCLGRAVLRLRGDDYWRFHYDELRKDGLSIHAGRLAWGTLEEIIDILGNPKTSVWRLLRVWRDR